MEREDRPTPSAPTMRADGFAGDTAGSLAVHRMQRIMSVLSARGECRTSQLAEQFQLSEMTIRRDLKELEAQGLLRRVHGGAVLVSHDVGYRLRVEFGQQQKQLIGRTAARLLKSGQTLYLDAGTTAMEVARAIRQGLPHVGAMRIVTHGINIAMELAGQIPYDLHLIGGEVYQNAFSTVGPAALEQIAGFSFDLFLMGAGGIDIRTGWTNTNHMEAAIKRAVMARSANVCAIADSGKWNHPSFAAIVPFGDVRHWIVDRALAPEAVDAARQAGIELIFADG